jgi:hypothetical protein
VLEVLSNSSDVSTDGAGTEVGAAPKPCARTFSRISSSIATAADSISLPLVGRDGEGY